MKDNAGQYNVRVEEGIDGRYGAFHVLTDRAIDDPFIRTVVRPAGWRTAWSVLCGRYEMHVCVDGSRAAHRAVFMSDYTPDPDGPSVVMAPSENLAGPREE